MKELILRKTKTLRVISVFALLYSILVPANSIAQTCAVEPIKAGQCWTTEDVINSEIDHHAQGAILRMFTRGGTAAGSASAMLCAAHSGELEGIYLPNQGVPAMRARDAGSNWWEMIPQGELATCYKDPVNRSPLIVFRKQIKDDRDMLASTLTTAWSSCNIPASAPRCYVPTISRPTKYEAVDSSSLLVNIVDSQGQHLVHGATIAVMDIANPSDGDGGLKIGVAQVEFLLSTGATYSVVGQGIYVGEATCEIGPAQQVMMESGVTQLITLKVPICVPVSGGV